MELESGTGPSRSSTSIEKYATHMSCYHDHTIIRDGRTKGTGKNCYRHTTAEERKEFSRRRRLAHGAAHVTMNYIQ